MESTLTGTSEPRSIQGISFQPWRENQFLDMFVIETNEVKCFEAQSANCLTSTVVSFVSSFIRLRLLKKKEN